MAHMIAVVAAIRSCTFISIGITCDSRRYRVESGEFLCHTAADRNWQASERSKCSPRKSNCGYKFFFESFPSVVRRVFVIAWATLPRFAINLIR